MSLPEHFGRYEVISVLGQGAMGLVYKAVDPVIERAVRVVIESVPPGARVRVNGLAPISTPYHGPMVLGDHEFQFIWGDQTSMTRAKIERDGQTIIGRRRQ